jgi:hypothetical protein
MKSFPCNKVDGQPCFDRPGLEEEIGRHEFCKITVESWSDAKEITLQQMRFFHGRICKAFRRL